MVKIVVESFGEDALRKLFCDLSHKEDWDEECSLCSMPTLLHKGSCSRKTEVREAEHSDLWKSWSLFRKKMEPIRKWYKEEMDKKSMNSELLKGLQEMTAANQKGLQEMTEAIMSGNRDRPNKLVKPAKVPSWSKGMKLEVYEKSLEVWMEMNKDLSEAVRYQDVIESLKMNKEIEGLAKYIGEHVIGKLDTIEKQKVKGIIELLDLKYGRTRLEELEELMEDWIKFNFNEHESEEEYLFAQEKMIARQEEKQVSLKEWNTVWMMYGAKQRKGIENYQLLELRKVVKADSVEVQKEFTKKYRELRIESNRGKTAPCADTFYMGKRSLSRQRYHEQRIRRDSQGRDFYQDRRGRNDSRGRPFFRRYYRRESDRPRSFSRDMRSISRNGRDRRNDRDRSKSERGRSNSEKGRTDERRSGSKDTRTEYKKCIGCKCNDCEKMRKSAKELNVQLCEGYDFGEEILVNFTEKGKQVMILDLGAPVSLAGNEWMDQYLKDHGLEVKDLKSSQCHQIFRFGLSKQYVSKRMVELPVIVRRLDGKEDVLKVFTYLVDADVPFLCGKREMVERWKSKIDTKNKVLETEIEGKRKDFRIVETGGNHVAIEIEKRDLKEEEIFFAKEEEDLNTFKAIRKVHMVANLKSAEQ